MLAGVSNTCNAVALQQLEDAPLTRVR